jgi:predicted RNA-binding protein with PIN domain
MTLVRILVDGHSLLEQWKDLAPGKPRHSEVAREELIARLTRYSDTAGTSITVVFDGATGPGDPILLPPDGAVEVLFSRPGQEPSQFVERLAQRLNGHGEFLVVADNLARPETIRAVRGSVSNCAGFIKTVQETLADLERQIASFNQKENQKFTQHG